MTTLIELLNPMYCILIVNILAFLWAIRSWKKNIRERWMNSLRDASADLIGAAKFVYGAVDSTDIASAKANFVAKEQKLLLLFAHDQNEQKFFKDELELLRIASENREAERYQNILKKFFDAINQRILNEWNDIK